MVVELTTTKDKFSYIYLMLWNGTLHLTEKELKLLAILLDKYEELKSQNISEKYLWEIMFSTPTRKYLKESMGNISNPYLGNILKGLKEKRVIIETETGYKLDSKIIPTKELTFKFNVIDG